MFLSLSTEANLRHVPRVRYQENLCKHLVTCIRIYRNTVCVHAALRGILRAIKQLVIIHCPRAGIGACAREQPLSPASLEHHAHHNHANVLASPVMSSQAKPKCRLTPRCYRPSCRGAPLKALTKVTSQPPGLHSCRSWALKMVIIRSITVSSQLRGTSNDA